MHVYNIYIPIFAQLPLVMLLVMKFHKVDQMAQQKIGASLVTSMISEYMKATTDAPSTRLATTLGLPPVLILRHQLRACSF
jgi:hypothetical protein